MNPYTPDLDRIDFKMLDELQRDGRMIEAIARIGRGDDAAEGTVFALPV